MWGAGRAQCGPLPGRASSQGSVPASGAGGAGPSPSAVALAWGRGSPKPFRGWLSPAGLVLVLVLESGKRAMLVRPGRRARVREVARHMGESGSSVRPSVPPSARGHAEPRAGESLWLACPWQPLPSPALVTGHSALPEVDCCDVVGRKCRGCASFSLSRLPSLPPALPPPLPAPFPPPIVHLSEVTQPCGPQNVAFRIPESYCESGGS